MVRKGFEPSLLVIEIAKRAKPAQSLPVRFAIVWLMVVRAFPATANLFVLFGLEIGHEHIELDYSFL